MGDSASTRRRGATWPRLYGLEEPIHSLFNSMSCRAWEFKPGSRLAGD